MSTNEASAKWINLLPCPVTDYITVPAGGDGNNYIVIDRNFYTKRLNCIHKYNINTNVWSKISGCNDTQNVSSFSAALDANKQILYLVHEDSLSQIKLNDSHINNHSHNITINAVSHTKTIILNDSLFIIGGAQNNSIWKWDLETKTLT
eukprot:213516_1